MISNKIGRYEILELLGQGAISAVYRAYDPHLGREVALKLITPQNPIEADRWRQRFRLREVRAAARLNHPHIVTVYDVGLEHEPPYLVMELLTGGTLKELLKQKFLPWREALTLLQPLCQALAYAHQAGIIHRDVKPANVMFAGDKARTLKLVDFGLARLQDLPEEQRITQTGSVMGTPAYMSPEQAREEVVDGRTDIFALGIICFEAINGRNPLDRSKKLLTLAEVISNQPIDTSPLVGKAPLEVIRLIERTIAKDRDERYPTCEVLLADLDRCLGTQTHDSTVRPDRPIIRKARNIHLTSEMEAVLRAMFSDFDSIAVKDEFGHGLSGGHAFRVNPVKREDQSQLSDVIKIAPIGLIQQEWEAYENHVKDTLPEISRIESDPISLPGIPWGGLRYALAGGGIFEFQSLYDYYHEASADDLLEVLEERLFKIMGSWWLHTQTRPNFQMQADYDALLPVNLLIKPINASSEVGAHLIEPGSLPPPPIIAGDHVQIKGFVITEVDEEKQQLTINLPPTAEGLPSGSYRLRLENVSDVNRYRVGHVFDSVYGEVTATRDDLLAQQASQALGRTIDPSMERLTSPSGLSLPNPLATYQDLLYKFLKVRISTIHRDLNLENILVDQNKNVTLIDFATARRGHVLHDLLRLETEVVTKLIPEALAEANLPPETIHAFYEQLHYATFHPGQSADPKLPHADLKKPFKTLMAIRKMARQCLFNQGDWTEYYQGLTLYLLGALKFKNLDELPEAPLPKQVAFWGAATIQKLLPRRKPLPPPGQPAIAAVKAALSRSQKGLLTFWADGCQFLYKRLAAIRLAFREKPRLMAPVVGVVAVVIFIALARLVPGVIPTPTATPTTLPITQTTGPETHTPTYTPPTTPTSTGTPSPTPTATPKLIPTAVVKAENLNLRSGPGTIYNIVGGLKQGDCLKVTGRNPEGNWLKVICPDGKEGWVASSQLVNFDVGVVPVATDIPPTPTPLPAPTLLEPDNAARFTKPQGQLFIWKWIRPLEEDEYFSIRIRPEGDREACCHHRTRDTQHDNLYGCTYGRHLWSVIVVREDSVSSTGWREISEASEERWFDFVGSDD